MCSHCTIRDLELDTYRLARGGRRKVNVDTLLLLVQDSRLGPNRVLLRSGNASRASVRRHVRRHHALSCQSGDPPPRLTA
jgi:hypothetical protein